MPTEAPTRPPASAFKLIESLETPTALREDGTVELILIRPCVGQGRGRHLYEAQMLEENAGVFAGWKMYANHQSKAAREALGGLPRPVEELAGRIIESRWDPTVPAEGRYGAGAVVGVVKPVGVVKKLIEEDPALLEASIRATATDVRPGEAQGQRVWIVEGIESKGSVDFVSEGGAGGRIKDLAEAAMTEFADDLTQVLEGLNDEEVLEYLREKRPSLLEEAGRSSEGDAMPIDPQELAEALQTDESREVLKDVLAPVIKEEADSLLESKLDEERDLIRAEARADADRQVALRDMRDRAHEMIEATKLPDGWKASLKSRYTLEEGQPSDQLDQVDEVDDEGRVSKPAISFLEEAVEEDIKEQRKLLAEAKPTKVRGQGAAKPDAPADEPDDPEAEIEEAEVEGEKPYHVEFLEEAGIDPEQAYAQA